MSETSKEKPKERMRLGEYLNTILTIVTILVMLLIGIEKIPAELSVVIVALLFLILVGVIYGHYGRILSEKLAARKKIKKRNTIARQNFTQFKVFVENLNNISYPLFRVRDELRNQYRNVIKEKGIENVGLLPIYLIESFQHGHIQNLSSSLEQSLNDFDGAFKYFCILIKQFDSILENFEEDIKRVSIFAREMTRLTEIEVNIENEYEEFRENYNAFRRDYQKYCQKLNKELNERIFRDYFRPIKKWPRITLK